MSDRHVRPLSTSERWRALASLGDDNRLELALSSLPSIRAPRVRIVPGAIQAELDHDVRTLVLAARGELLHAGDARNLILYDLRDAALDNLGRCAPVGCRHGHDRRIDVGKFAHSQPADSEQAKNDQDQAQDSGEHRAAY